MTELPILLLVAATFLLAGGVKGVIGLGLPTVSLAILTATVGLQPAMALLLVPSFVTNLWQGVVGGNFLTILKRTWFFLLMATVTVWLGGLVLVAVDVSWLSALLGLLLVTYSALSLTRPAVSLPNRWESWASPLTGTINGVLTGMTGSFVVPGVLYLQAIGLPRDQLIQAMGMLFTVSTVALAVSLGGQNLLSAELGTISIVSVVPAIIGMVLGQKLRQRLSEDKFRKVFFSSILILGLYIIARSLIA
ncbi:MAG: sulfite exporter TauE/SafE family protein [Rhodospirillaceae bacterium]|nr:sulfite exporter TauE/SafE family protein [Rhodospirillaceae bacterium]MDD9924919.1 sulfite exporter TauE/SafE family protein [Rhodospirillaceae bacterium]